ncbi:VOC family protein [Archangium violaceum]|uniref:VOC family protein n=1 Tax=Archangium violaceum TaxID=83451 RepID=UPI0019507200|nr:VOC family protein [Archangium violaceum]QRN95629.1 VOC family protein [Archangium violaceum]
MKNPAPILGLRTTVYPVTDLVKAKDWYSQVLGVAPYFDEPFYVGFNVGGFELGLDPDTSTLKPGAGGAVSYWGVENADREWERLTKLGAEPVSPVRDVGGGIRVATVKDPFGNLFGVIENPHFPNTEG